MEEVAPSLGFDPAGRDNESTDRGHRRLSTCLQPHTLQHDLTAGSQQRCELMPRGTGPPGLKRMHVPCRPLQRAPWEDAFTEVPLVSALGGQTEVGRNLDFSWDNGQVVLF